MNFIKFEIAYQNYEKHIYVKISPLKYKNEQKITIDHILPTMGVL